MDSGASPDGRPANDALLVQLVRGTLGRRGRSARINVSSCKLVVTLHGITSSAVERNEIEVSSGPCRGFGTYPTS